MSFKLLVWFKANEPIPMNASYIKSETRTQSKWDVDGTCHSISEDYFLYEVEQERGNE